MATGNALIVAWLAGLAVTSGLLALLWWALFADRSRGQHRCPRCWHLIDPSVGRRCPECGRVSTDEHHLLRTRRRWGTAALALACLLAGTLWLRVLIADLGWWTLMPHRVVLGLLPWISSARHVAAVRQHMLDELQAGHVSSDDAVRMLDLAKAGSPDLPAGSDAWLATWGRWLASLEGRYDSVTDAASSDLRAAAMGLPPVVAWTVPDRWWPGEPLTGEVAIRDWWPARVAASCRMRSVEGLPMQDAAGDRLSRTRWRRSDRDPMGNARQAFTIDLGAMPEGEHHGTVTLEWSTSDASGAASATGTVRLPVHVAVGGRPPSMEPLRDPEVDALVRSAFESGLQRRESTPPEFGFSYAPFRTGHPSLRDVAFGLVVEACEAGTPRRTLRVWWRGGSGRAPSGWEPAVEDLDGLARLGNGADWTMRVRGDPTLARRAADDGTESTATRWWDGSLEFPLRVESRPAGEAFGTWRAAVTPSGVAPAPSR